MQRDPHAKSNAARPRLAGLAGLAGWLLARLQARLRGAGRGASRLALVDRIALAPRQSLALVEAEGRRFLVATSQDGAPAFYPLDEPLRSPTHTPGPHAPGSSRPPLRSSASPAARVSW